jgi:hypothetical protein
MHDDVSSSIPHSFEGYFWCVHSSYKFLPPSYHLFLTAVTEKGIIIHGMHHFALSYIRLSLVILQQLI